jgi:hypothetical protein
MDADAHCRGDAHRSEGKLTVARLATITQAEVARVIRAAKAEGLTVVRIVARVDGFAVETDQAPAGDFVAPAAEKPRPVL